MQRAKRCRRNSRQHGTLAPGSIAILTTLAFAIAPTGCSMHNNDGPPPAFPRGMSIAVAPILNFSGNFDLDPIKSADLLASELTDFDGIVVLPVSRVVAALIAEGRDQIESPRHALDIARRIGADAILVAGVTEYDPYTPTVGLVLQLYAQSGERPSFLREESVVRANTPAGLAASEDSLTPIGQIQKVYNATHDDVVSDVERYAHKRSAGDSPYGWQEYLKVQTQYLRFCWHDALARMATRQSGLFAAASDQEQEHAE